MLFLLLFLILLSAGSYSAEFYYHQILQEEDQLSFETDGEYTRVSLEGGISLSEIGEPDLPWKIIRLALPPQTRIHEYHYDSDRRILAGSFSLKTAESFRIDGDTGHDTLSLPIMQTDLFPGEIIRIQSEGYLHGVHIATIAVCPFQYETRTGRLYFLHDIELTLTLIDDAYIPMTPLQQTHFSKKTRIKMLEGLVSNPEELTLWISSQSPSKSATSTLNSRLNSFPPHPRDDPVDLLIITLDGLLPHVSGLEQEYFWGVIPEIVTISQINAFYWGSDIQESIREFIKEAYLNWGISYLLLVGDHPDIPVRMAYSSDNEGNWVHVPTDLYYSALDGYWNYDHDSEFGDSPEDDNIPLLISGRIALNDPVMISTFLSKLRQYRFSPRLDYLNKWLYAAAALSHDGMDTMGPTFKENMNAAFSFPAGTEFYKLYAHHGTSGGDAEITAEAFIEQLGEGYHIINHIDHGNRYFLGMGQKTGGGGLSITDVDNLDNGPYFPAIFYSFSCDVNAIDADNVAKHWLANPEGGGLAFIGNTRTAWTGQMAMDSIFFRAFINDPQTTLGEATNRLITLMPFRQYFRYIPTLTGHPLMKVWFEIPSEPRVTISPANLRGNDNTLHVVVTDSADHPIENALVTMFSSRRKFAMDSTNSLGQAIFNINLWNEEYLIMAVTGSRLLPWVDTLMVASAAGPNPMLCSFEVLEADGDGDELPESGERALLNGYIKNRSIVRATSIELTFSCPGLTFIQNTANYAALPGHDSLSFHDSILVQIPADIVDRRIFRVSVFINASEGEWLDSMTFVACGPDPLHISTRYIDSLLGDGDGVPDPGESAHIVFSVLNRGAGEFSYNALSIEGSEHLIIITDSLFASEIAVMACSSFYFPVEIGASYSAGTLPYQVQFHTNYDLEYRWALQLYVPNSPDSLWTHPGFNNIRLYWLPPEFSIPYGYFVYRSQYPDSGYRRITPTPLISSTYFNDFPLPGRSTFYYRLSTVDSGRNESPLSTPVSGWTSYPYFEPWPLSLSSSVIISGTPVLADIDGDDLLELFVGAHDGNIYGFYSNAWEIFDSTSTRIDPFVSVDGMIAWASPALGDLNNDGQPEIVVVSRGTDRAVYAFNMEGHLMPGWPRTINTPTLNCPALADLNGDGNLEILVATEARRLYVWRYNGEAFLEDGDPSGLFSIYTADTTSGCVTYSAPAIGDIDFDGDPEIVVCGNRVPWINNGTVYAWDINGEPVDGWPVLFSGVGGSSPVLGNLDDDENTLEIVIAAKPNKVWVFTHDGTVLHGWPVTTVNFVADITTPPALADLDGDNRCEVIVAGQNGISVIGSDGVTWPGWPVPNFTNYWAAPTVADINDDGELEIICPFEYAVWAYSERGIPLPGFPLNTDYTVLASPTIVDMNNDGRLEIIITSWDSYIYIWECDGLSTSAKPWFTHRGNFHRNGNYSSNYSSIRESELPRDIGLKLFPTPFNANLNIVVENRKGSSVALSIFDIMGRKVFSRDYKMLAFRELLVWGGVDQEGLALPSGVYFISLYFPGEQRTISQKAILLK